MRYYYGAEELVLKPEFGRGNHTNDYGQGFYLTPDKDIARLWASKNEQDGFLIEYDLDLSKLRVLYLDTIKDDDVLRWIAILVSHRFSYSEINNHKTTIKWLEENYPIDMDGYDVIVGYRADDSYFDYSRDFVNNNLSIEILKEAMRIGKLGIQVVLISQESFKHIKYLRHEVVPKSDSYKLFKQKTKEEYFKLKKEDDINNRFLRDIMREKNKDD